MKIKSLAVLLSVFVLCSVVSAQDYSIRVTYNTNLRDASSLQGSIVETVPSGTILHVVGEFGNWLMINRNGNELWMADWVGYSRVADGGQTQFQIDNCCFVDRQCHSDAEWTSGYWAFQNNQCVAPLQSRLQISSQPANSSTGSINNCCFLDWQCNSDEEWARGHFAFHTNQCKHRGLEIEGAGAFVLRIEEALDILKNRAPQWYAYSISGLTKIREVPEDEGAGVYLHTGVFSITPGHISPGVLWLASAMVHEACHVHRAATGLVPGGLTGERECLRVQIEATDVFDYQDRHVPGLRYVLENINDLEFQWWH